MIDWDRFFKWLNPDSDSAASEYKILRQTLISFFKKRECADAEFLADATIERVAELLPRFGDELPANPLRYCYGVAKYMHKEYVSKEVLRRGGDVTDAHPDPYDHLRTADQEILDRCLSTCLLKLDPSKRDTFTRYYLVDPQTKCAIRQSLADQLGINIKALRLQMFRLKEELRRCITACRSRETKA